jgi:hypothetical protein
MHLRGSKTVDMKLLFLHTLIQIMFLNFKIPLTLSLVKFEHFYEL